MVVCLEMHNETKQIDHLVVLGSPGTDAYLTRLRSRDSSCFVPRKADFSISFTLVAFVY